MAIQQASFLDERMKQIKYIQKILMLEQQILLGLLESMIKKQVLQRLNKEINLLLEKLLSLLLLMVKILAKL